MVGPLILLADDDADLRRAMMFILGARYEVSEAGDGPEAIEAMTRRCPDLLVLDMSMPGMGGLEVLAVVREARPSLPVIILTADNDIAGAVKALDLGARTYITKPFDPGMLLEEVARAMEARPDAARADATPWRVV